jgi:ACS family D-galactonate transporter-like MFS transporter
MAATASGQAGQLRESPQRWWLMVLLATGMIVCYAHRGALSAAAPFMMRELGLSTAVTGILLSAFFWSYSFMQVPAGWVVDRFGVRRSYACGFALWSVASAFTGFSGSLVVLILVRMLVGVGQSVSFPASARAVANSFQDRERGTVTATYLTGVRLGQALITGIGGLLLAAYGFKLFFLIVGLAPLVWLPPWALFLKRWEKPAQPSPSRTPSLKSQVPDRGGGLTPGSGSSAPAIQALPAPQPLSFFRGLALMKQRSALGIFLGFFAYDYAWYVYVTWLQAYLAIERKFTPGQTGAYSSIAFVTMSVVILLSGLLSDWLVRRGHSETLVRKSCAVAGLAAACLIVPAGLVDDRVTSVWLLIVALAGLGIASPNTWTLTQAVCERRVVGTVSGIQNFGGNLGGVLAPALTGYIVHATHSFTAAFVITGGILVAGILAYCFLIAKRVEAL